MADEDLLLREPEDLDEGGVRNCCSSVNSARMDFRFGGVRFCCGLAFSVLQIGPALLSGGAPASGGASGGRRCCGAIVEALDDLWRVPVEVEGFRLATQRVGGGATLRGRVAGGASGAGIATGAGIGSFG